MTTPAGWYKDPDDQSQLRYWDGDAWTGHRTPIVEAGTDDTAAMPAVEAARSEPTQPPELAESEPEPETEPAAEVESSPAEILGRRSGGRKLAVLAMLAFFALPLLAVGGLVVLFMMRGGGDQAASGYGVSPGGTFESSQMWQVSSPLRETIKVLAVDDGVVVLLGECEDCDEGWQLLALDSETGDELWTKPIEFTLVTRSAQEVTGRVVGGNFLTLAVHLTDERGMQLIALDLRTGAESWRADPVAAAVSTWVSSGDFEVLTAPSGRGLVRVAAVDSNTGDTLFEHRGSEDIISRTVGVTDEHVVVMDFDRSTAEGSLADTTYVAYTREGTEAWRFEAWGPYLPPNSVGSATTDVVLAADVDGLIGLDISTGEELWTAPLRAAEDTRFLYTVVDDERDRVIVCIEADRQFEIRVLRLSTGDRLWTRYVDADGGPFRISALLGVVEATGELLMVDDATTCLGPTDFVVMDERNRVRLSAVDGDEGSVVWSVTINDELRAATPLGYRVPPGRLYFGLGPTTITVGSGGDGARALDPATGDVLLQGAATERPLVLGDSIALFANGELERFMMNTETGDRTQLSDDDRFVGFHEGVLFVADHETGVVTAID